MYPVWTVTYLPGCSTGNYGQEVVRVGLNVLCAQEAHKGVPTAKTGAFSSSLTPAMLAETARLTRLRRKTRMAVPVSRHGASIGSA